MIIYPLPPQELDDKTLNQQIKAIAQVLCNVHHDYLISQGWTKQYKAKANTIPLGVEFKSKDYDRWGLTCRANYNELVRMGLACCEEYTYRNSKKLGWNQGIFFKGNYYESLKQHKLQSVIEWCEEKVPDLPNEFYDIDDCCKYAITIPKKIETPFPLVMPEKYIVYKGISRFPGTYTDEPNYEETYRNYYRAKLPKDAKWTRREKPEWL